ncbi:hypothetical protein WDZ17_14195 [Pseudokineococcus basanitobsidens]|uniref:Uncharacterized protein n=1 Tax=Pseudokineococcus basanitobsidens TaxID=1926649 RepID=A0ABU8RN96_9ACTN
MPKKVVRVTPKQVDAARAEVDAFRAIGREPDPAVLLIAKARPRPRSATSSSAGQDEAPAG